MEKLKMQSENKIQKNLGVIAKYFPNVITEDESSPGGGHLSIDFELLHQELSDVLVEGNKERYRFEWPGKRQAILNGNSSITATLRPCREESIDFDTTGNLYIEGDNLDVLKLLQETYLGKIKMIYIDPPYNTGNDSFVYEDNRHIKINEFANRSKQRDDSGNLLFDLRKNNESNGRFHSDWLDMIYPRLKIAKDLLSNEGVIFISVDDNEDANLRKVCDEIFGEHNFIAQIIWKKRSTPPNDQVIGAAHEYILIFAKDINDVVLNLRQRNNEQLSRYKNPDNHPKGPWTPGDLGANIKGGRYVASLNYPIVNPTTKEEHYPPQNGNWRFNKETIDKLLANNEIYFGEDGKGRPKLKRFLSEVKNGITYTSLWDFVPLNTQGSKEMTDILGNIAVFDNPKPSGLIKELCKLGTSNNSMILDFFSGSATTAHAVMRLNAEDNGNRKFIMVQLPEACDEKSEAFKAGYKNICEIGKERIRRAAIKIREEHPTAKFDAGFRVLKLDSSNMKDVYYKPAEYQQGQIDMFADNVKVDRNPEDLLFQVMLDVGALPSSKVITTVIGKKKIFNVADNYLLACFETNVSEEVVKNMAKLKPIYAVFRDNGFANDDMAANSEQLFKTLSPNTKVRVL